MERSDVRSLYLLAAFLVGAYALPFVVGIWYGTVRWDEAWLGYLGHRRPLRLPAGRRLRDVRGRTHA